MGDAAVTGNAAGVSMMAEQGSSAYPVLAAGEDTTGRGELRFKFTTALVLAVAGLASAWASFQGGLWDKLESEQYALANSHLTESSQLLIRSGQEQAFGAALFLQWLDAMSNKQEKRAKIIEHHMPP